MIRVLALRAEGLRVISSSEPHVQFLLPGELSGRWQGRSAYLCHTSACVAIALKRKSLNRALKCALPGDILEKISQALSHEAHSR